MAASTSKAKETALITGASSGIGAELARLFAADGVDLVLVARNAERLAACADEIKARYAVDATILTKDLSLSGAAAEVHGELLRRGITVNYLVNNAGVGAQGDFSAIPLARELSMMHLNMDALVGLTHCFLPEMLARKSGKILNVASLAAYQPGGPGAAVYYASKAFVLSFSRGLAAELRNSGVSVTALCPGPVATRFQEEGGFGKTPLFNSPLVDRPEQIAEAGYRAMRQGWPTCIPGLFAKLLALGGQLPARAIVLRINRMLLGRRE